MVNWSINNKRPAYTTDVSDIEWQIAEPLIPDQKRRGPKIQYDRREVLNGIFYLIRNGCGWLFKDGLGRSSQARWIRPAQL